MEAGREADAWVAENIMGYIPLKPTFSEYYFLVPNEDVAGYIARPVSSWLRTTGGILDTDFRQLPHYKSWALPHYTTDIAAAYAMEQKIHELGYGEGYVNNLIQITAHRYDDMTSKFHTIGRKAIWNCLRATPLERCRAARAWWESTRKEG